MAAGSFTLGGNLSVAVGPLGRNAEGTGALNTKGQLAAMYSYSKTKGLFGGMSVEGSVIAERGDANRIAYGDNLTAKQILTGTFDPPDWAYHLIDVLDGATSLPGGQTWVEDEDMGAMGRTPQRKGAKAGSGYAFGEGLGAGGSRPANRKRSSSLWSIGSSKSRGNDSDRNVAVFDPNPTSTPSSNVAPRERISPDGTPTDRAPPARPWERRSSTLIPSMNFGKAKGDRRAGPSSETYNANGGPAAAPARPRASSNPRRPYEVKATPSPFSSEFGSRGATPTSRSAVTSPTDTSPTDSPIESPRVPQSQDLLDFGNGGSANGSSPNRASSLSYGGSSLGARKGSGVDDSDLLGTWNANDKGLTASFARLSAGVRSRSGSLGSNGTPNRSRRGSGTILPFDDIAEDTALERAYQNAHPGQNGKERSKVSLRESTSVLAGRDWTRDLVVSADTTGNSNGGRKARPFSTYAAPSADWSEAEFSSTSPRKNGYGNGHANGNGSHSSRHGSYSNGNGHADVHGRRSSSNSYSNSRSRSRDDSDDERQGYDFDDSSYPFDDYAPRHTTGPKPVLARKAGLDDKDGYARAVALFDFSAAESGDLGFKKGQVVVVLDSAGAGGDWWRGKLATSTNEGIFPSNYVEVLNIPQDLRGGLTKGQLKTRVHQLDFD